MSNPNDQPAKDQTGKDQNGQDRSGNLSILEGPSGTPERRAAMRQLALTKDPDNVPLLLKYSADPNPEVVMQAIVGMHYFRNDEAVAARLQELRTHPNDMVRDMADQETGSFPAAERGHADSPDFMKNVLVDGDALSALSAAPDASVHLTFTSPPYYNARSYSVYPTYELYLAFLDRVFREVHRITKEGRFLVVNTSPVIMYRADGRYSSRRYAIPFDLHTLLQAMGWEFVDDIVWRKPESSVPPRNGNFNKVRLPLTWKPNACNEYLMVYRKRTLRQTKWNLNQYDDAVKDDSLIEEWDSGNIWDIAPVSSSVHTAVFPDELCNRVVRYYSFASDLVCDPFAGSGTLGQSAIRLRRYCFLCENNPEYVERIGATLMGNLENGRVARTVELAEFQRIAAERQGAL